MPVSAEDQQFLNGPFKAIEGWCMDEAAWLTTHLLRYQQSKQRTAPSFEIGVFYGKYLSVIQNCSRTVKQPVFGFDTYEWVPVSTVEAQMQMAFGSMEGIRLVPGDSTKMSSADLSAHLNGEKVGFVSVDGAHTPDAVFSDMGLTESVLAPWGIVAIDDFMNPMAIGVNDGAMRYWYKTNTNLVPFCYCRNKLLAAHKEFAEEYSLETLKFAEENPLLPNVKIMLENKAKQGLHWAKQEFLGTTIWSL
jgi:hypothetical protein